MGCRPNVRYLKPYLYEYPAWENMGKVFYFMEDLKEDVVCRNCGSINNITITEKGGQLVARCNHCDKFIKNIPQGAPQQFYFGKYKGVPFEKLIDLSYLKWANEKVKLGAKAKDALLNRINQLENPGQ